jgi:hypothetical protein
MLVEEVIEFLGRQSDAGEFTLDNTDPLYIRAMLPGLRSNALRVAYNGDKFTAATKVISPEWYQQIDITIDKDVQIDGAEYLVFNLPTPLSLGTNSGVSYFGRKDIVSRFIPARSMAEVYDYKSRGYIGDGKSIVYLPKTRNNYLVFGNKMLKDAHLVAMLDNPFEDPNWDDLTSNFPVDENALSIMRRLYRQDIAFEEGQIVDNINDGTNTPQLANIKQNTK